MDYTALGTTGIIAIMMIPLVSIIKRPSWGTKINYLIGMGAALVAALIGGVVDGKIKKPSEALAYIGTAYASSQMVYNLVFKDTQVNADLTDMVNV